MSYPYDPKAPTYKPIEGEDRLRAAVKAAGFRLRISVTARQKREPAIEIYPRDQTYPVCVVRSTESALNWLREWQERHCDATR